MIVKRNVFLFTLLLPLTVLAQVKNSTYAFLNTTHSARMAAMGTDLLSIRDHDLTLSVTNPSLITEKMDRHLALNFIDYFAGISSGFVTYARQINHLGKYQGSLQFINYGRFTAADPTGFAAGTFSANELALSLGWGRALGGRFSIGSNAKIIYSNMESYWSFGFAVDLAGTYMHSDNGFTMSLLARNLGRQLRSYVPGNNEPLPMNIQWAMSKKLQHLPFRFNLIADHLEKPNLAQYDQDETDPQGNGISVENTTRGKFAGYADQLFRHIIIGGELMLSDNFHVRAGYNYRRRQEMKVNSRISTIGFSWGFGFNISSFHFDFGRATYHLAGAPNYITITSNLSALMKTNKAGTTQQ